MAKAIGVGEFGGVSRKTCLTLLMSSIVAKVRPEKDEDSPPIFFVRIIHFIIRARIDGFQERLFRVHTYVK